MTAVNSLYCLLLVAFSLSFVSCSDGKKEPDAGVLLEILL